MEGGAVGHNFEGDTPRNIYAKFGSIWPSCFRGEDFFNQATSVIQTNYR
jgi:hypothetical protein